MIRDVLSQHIFYHFLYPRIDTFHRDFFRVWKQKRNYQFLDRSSLQALQLQELKNLIHVAYNNSIYYRDLMDKIRLCADDIRSLDDLKRIPILTKDLIRENIEHIKIPDANGLLCNSSGGSTGTVLNFYQDASYLVNRAATVFISDNMQGWYLGARTAYLWGASQDVKETNKIRTKIKRYFLNQEWYDTFNMGTPQMAQYHESLSKFCPEIIIAYASSAYILAKFLEENQLKTNYPTRSIITSAEVLFPYMRDVIQHVFKVDVFNRYGSREVGCIASECNAHLGLHLHMYDHIIECLDPKTGRDVYDEPGELIVTVLHNYGMPFIRYQIGDMGIITKEKCPCGRGSYMLKKLVGRTSDTITTKSGRLIHGEYFTHVFYGIEGIVQFQFVQESLDDYQLFIVKNESFKEESLVHIRKEIYDVLDANSKLSIKFVDKIDAPPSGKHRFTISKIPVDVTL